MSDRSAEDALARILREEINREIIDGIRVQALINRGWTAVSDCRPPADAAEDWAEETLLSGWCRTSVAWLFKDPDEALLFKMRWL